jgi:hypothetical protein
LASADVGLKFFLGGEDNCVFFLVVFTSEAELHTHSARTIGGRRLKAREEQGLIVFGKVDAQRWILWADNRTIDSDQAVVEPVPEGKGRVIEQAEKSNLLYEVLAPCSEVPVPNPVHRFIGKDTLNLAGSCQKKRVGDQDGVCEDITVAVIISELEDPQTVSVNRVKAYKVRPAFAEVSELFRGKTKVMSLNFLLTAKVAGALG